MDAYRSAELLKAASRVGLKASDVIELREQVHNHCSAARIIRDYLGKGSILRMQVPTLLMAAFDMPIGRACISEMWLAEAITDVELDAYITTYGHLFADD